MLLEDEDGYPWTASIHIFWMVLLAFLTGGAIVFLLGIYLSLWIRGRGRSWLPTFCFASSILLITCSIAMRGSRVGEDAYFVGTLLLIAGSFSLRHEIQRHFRTREGWTPFIHPFWTFGFCSVYINYCLTADRRPRPDTLVSLGL